MSLNFVTARRYIEMTGLRDTNTTLKSFYDGLRRISRTSLIIVSSCKPLSINTRLVAYHVKCSCVRRSPQKVLIAGVIS